MRGDDPHLDHAGTLLSSDDWQMFGEEFGRLEAERSLTVPCGPDNVHEQAMPHDPESAATRVWSVPRERKPGRISESSDSSDVNS